jgi:tetratricopeptide (TPR) repeat protein
VVVIVVGILLIYHHHQQAQKDASNIANADSLIIGRFKNSKDVSDKRALISAYTEQGDYDAALPIAKEIAAATRTYQDYMAVLSICGLNDVKGKQECLSQVDASLKPLVGKMPFSSAYAAGVILEKNGIKKDAAVFYQRALDTYAPDPKAQNMMTKEQLKAKIDELRK